jgi:hypothetical protein
MSRNGDVSQRKSTPNMDAKAGFFYFREIFGMTTSVLTIGTTAPIIIFMYLENPTILDDLETCKYVSW